MAEDRPTLAGQEGTTLAELLVVMLLLAIVGSITTVGIVRGFNAQLTAQNVSETLDGTRLATQRVRDFVRGADEVCASSTDTSLVLWTDDNADAEATPEELDIFELVPDASGDDVFQRRVPNAAGDEIQLIRDDIVNDALFVYTDGDVALDPKDQPTDLECLAGASVTGGLTRIRTVQVQFRVENPDPAEPDLTTETSVRIRNADLSDAPDTSPTANFVFTCPNGTQQCSFDASGSTDDGSLVSYEWDFGDGNVSGVLTGPTTTHTYATGDTSYDVTLTVTDDEGRSGTVIRSVKPGLASGNAKPTAAFTVVCNGRICDFDGSDSTDDGVIVSWTWNFGDGTAQQTTATPLVSHTFGVNGTYPVSLTVVDGLGLASDPVILSVTASTGAIRVKSLNVTVTNKTDVFDARFEIQVGRTTTGSPGAGITVSVDLAGGVKRSDSCSTDGTGRCFIEVLNIPNTKGNSGNLVVQSLTVKQLNDTNNVYVYDADQNLVDRITVNKNKKITRYKGNTEVTP